MLAQRRRHCANIKSALVQRLVAGPDGSFALTGACNLEVPGSNPGRAGYLSSWLPHASLSMHLRVSSSCPVSKHDTLKQCRINVGPASKTLGQHYASIGSTYLITDWTRRRRE